MSLKYDTNVEIKNFRPELRLAPMTSVISPEEKAWWLLQVRLTPYTASKAGLKYEPESWSGVPLVRIVWVRRDGRLAEFHEILNSGEEVAIPAVWELSVQEVIYMADRYSHLGAKDTEEWMWEAQAESSLITDAIEWEFQKHEMAMNRSSIGPAVTVQRNGFPHELRRRKLRESSQVWRNK